jgi:hypothetical protein
MEALFEILGELGMVVLEAVLDVFHSGKDRNE